MQLAWNASLQVRNNERVFVGIGQPMLAAMIAQLTHAPDVHLMFESGVDEAHPKRAGLSTGSAEVATGAARLGSMLDVFAQLQRGDVDLGLLGAAQVDCSGRLNSTVLGDYAQPRIRLPGSGGAHDIVALARRVVVVTVHDPRRLVERVDFITCDRGGSHSTGDGDARGGVVAVVTERGMFAREHGQLVLVAVAHGTTEDDALEGISWARGSQPLEEIPPIPNDYLTRFDFLEEA